MKNANFVLYETFDNIYLLNLENKGFIANILYICIYLMISLSLPNIR